MREAGLICELENKHFNRDTLYDARVLEITENGIDYIEALPEPPYKATWLRLGNFGTPDHDLKVCLSLASIELAAKAAGLEFIPCYEMLARAPEATRKLQNPFRFDLHTDRKKNYALDGMFQVKYPTGYITFFYELDITNHGEAYYRDRFQFFNDIILGSRFAREQLGITHNINVLTATITPVRMQNLISYLPPRNKHFLFKTIIDYGKLRKPPAPNLAILDEWYTAKGELVSLKGESDGQSKATGTTG